MKKIALAISLLAALSIPAFAADDLGYVPAGHDWSGIYAGVHVGGGWGDKNWDRVQGYSGSGPSSNISNYDTRGIFGGGQIGINMQSGSFVYGAEAEVSISGVNGDDRPRFNYFETDVNFIGSVTGRAGFAADSFLVFAEGGLALVNDQHSHRTNGGGNPVISADEFRAGWLIGGGVEWAWSDLWSAEVEYNYMDFGTDRVTLSDPGGSAIFDIDQKMHTVKFGVNRKF